MRTEEEQEQIVQDNLDKLTAWKIKTGGGADSLTKRDWFAGQALTGVIQTVNETGGIMSADVYPKVIAAACYAIADAMIKARKK